MKRIYILFSLIFLFSFLNAQDIKFTMPYSSPLYLNPAFAGSAGMLRVSGSYRNQLPNISENFVSSSVSLDRYIKFIIGGIGINYFNDRQGMGTTTMNRVSVIYSAHIPLFKNKWVLKPAIEGAYGRNYFDWSKLSFGSPQYGFVYGDKIKQIVSYPDFSSGILIYSEKFFGGFAVHHLNEPETSFLYNESNLPQKYTAHAGANITLRCEKKVMISPSFVYLQQQDFRTLLINLAIQSNVMCASIGYRNGDNMIASVGFRTKTFRMAYGYDVSVSRLGIVTAGSHEVSLSVFLKRKKVPAGFLPFETASF